jgi:hypothetical protein
MTMTMTVTMTMTMMTSTDSTTSQWRRTMGNPIPMRLRHTVYLLLCVRFVYLYSSVCIHVTALSSLLIKSQTNFCDHGSNTVRPWKGAVS